MKTPMQVVLISALAGLILAGLALALVRNFVSPMMFFIGLLVTMAVFGLVIFPITRRMQKELSSLRCPGCGRPLSPFATLQLETEEPVRRCPHCGTKLPGGASGEQTPEGEGP
jgi:hypothetical protein